MNNFKDNYREFFESFAKSVRFIYGVESGHEPEAAETVDVKGEVPTKEPVAEPLTAKNFDAHQQKFDKHMEALAKLNPEKVDAMKKDFGDQIKALKAEYEQHLKDPSIIENVEQVAATKIAPKVSALINSINDRIKAAGGAPVAEQKAADVPQPTTAAAEPAAAPPAEPETTKDVEAQAETLTTKEREAVTEKILAQLKIKDADLTDKITKLIPELNITKEQLKEAGTEALQLTPDQIKLILTEMLPPKLQVKSREEFTTLKDFTSWSNLDDLFDDFDDPAFTYISQHHKIEGPEEGKEGILIDGKPITEIAQLKEFMPPNAQDKFDAIVNDVGDHEEAFTKLMEGHNQTGERMMQLRAELESQIAKGPERVGTMEGLVALLKLFAEISKAFKTGDWETLGDFMEIYKQGPTKVAKAYNESIKAYKEGVKDKKDIGQLVSAYLNPRGPEADTMFGTEGPGKLFRAEAKPAIQNHLAAELGLTVTEIKGEKGGIPTILAYDPTTDTNYEINLYIGAAGTEVQINELTVVDEKTVRNPVAKKQAVTDLAAIKSLLPVGTSKAPPPSTDTDVDANETDLNKLPTNKYIGKNGELKGIEKATRIHDVLPKDIQEAVIIANKARQGFKKDQEIAVIKEGDTFVIKKGENIGKRAWVYNGDKIKSVVRAKKEA